MTIPYPAESLDGRGCIALLYAVLRMKSADEAVQRAGVGCSAKRRARVEAEPNEFRVFGMGKRLAEEGST